MIITQAMLAEFQAFKELEKGKEELRLRIVHLLEEQAMIEQGPLTAKLKITSQRRLSKESLAAILGPVAVDEIMAKIPPKNQIALTVEAL